MLGIRRYQGVAIDLFQGDITAFACDVMVNAANERLAAGGGVDGAVHRVGGPGIAEECRRIGGCPPGKAVYTRAGSLPAQWLIHAVGPLWCGGHADEERLLSSAYSASLALAEKLKQRHVAMPALSTGAYGYPVELASGVALRTVKEFVDVAKPVAVKRLTFVLYTAEHYQRFQEQLFATFPEEDD